MKRRAQLQRYRRRRLLLVYGVGLLLCLAILRQVVLGTQPVWNVVFACCDLWHLYVVVCSGFLRLHPRPRPQYRQHARARRQRSAS